MKVLLTFCVIGGCLLGFLPGCINDTTYEHRDLAYQRSTIDALLAGRYDDTFTFEDLARYGDFGIGTLNGIDGEMLALDGAFYQVKTDGIPYLIPRNMHTPFATVEFFQADSVLRIPENLNYPDLLAYMDKVLSSANDLYALKIKCELDSADLRSVPLQHPPYKPLAEVISQEVIFSHTNISGTLVGFRFPTFLQGVNVPGYHFHFISDDKKSGGHVLNLRINKGTLQIDRAAEFMLSFPEDDAFSNINLSVDRTEDLQKVERNQ